MRSGFLSTCVMVMLFSCNKSFYGTYSTNYSSDKSVFFQIKLNRDGTVEKTETHTVRDFATGKYAMLDSYIVCYLDLSKNMFPPDTLTFRLKGNRLFFVLDGKVTKKFYLKKN